MTCSSCVALFITIIRPSHPTQFETQCSLCQVKHLVKFLSAFEEHLLSMNMSTHLTHTPLSVGRKSQGQGHY
jgi:hypothetical protein